MSLRKTKRPPVIKKKARELLIRKEIRALSADERDKFISSVLELKRLGLYDHYVHAHHQIMIPTVLCGEPRHPEYRNGAHQGPAFLPWHRAFLLQFEADLRKIDPSVTVPYWDWTLDAVDPLRSPIWSDKWMGGNGDPNDHNLVKDGPFAQAKGQWHVEAFPEYGYDIPGLRRTFQTHVTSLPTPEDLDRAMKESFYDLPPYNADPTVRGFRNVLEGWRTNKADPAVTTDGSQLHNRVHLWIGGHMYWMVSPSDPVFFLHHCFIDKIWADWQAQKQLDDSQWAPHYAPMECGPRGHNYYDRLKPFQVTVEEMMDIKELGYQYDPTRQLIRSAPKSPFEAP